MMTSEQEEAANYPPDTNLHQSFEQLLNVEPLPLRRKKSRLKKSISHSPDTNLLQSPKLLSDVESLPAKKRGLC